MFIVGSISVLRDKLLLLTLYTCHKIVIKFLVLLSGKNLIFEYKFLNIVNILIIFIFLFQVCRVNLWEKFNVMLVREFFIFLKGFQCKFTNLLFKKIILEQ